jgi:hypothetical protein
LRKVFIIIVGYYKILPDSLIEHRGLNSLFSFFVYTLLSPFWVKNFFNLYSSKRKVNQKNNFLVLIAPFQKIKKSRPPVEAGEKD